MGRGETDLDALLGPPDLAPGRRAQPKPPPPPPPEVGEPGFDPGPTPAYPHKLHLQGGPYDGEVAYSRDALPRSLTLRVWVDLDATEDGTPIKRFYAQARERAGLEDHIYLWAGNDPDSDELIYKWEKSPDGPGF